MRVFGRRDRGADRLLRDALKRVNAHGASAAGSPTDVQLLGQVSSGDDWAQIRDYWTRRAGLTGSWPTRLGANERIINLWPIPPGSLQLTAGVGLKPPKRQPRKLLSTPALLSFDASQSGEDALAQAIVSWLDDTVVQHNEYPAGVALAPPILEEWATKGRLIRRVIVARNVEWPLPAADGVTWPPAAAS